MIRRMQKAKQESLCLVFGSVQEEHLKVTLTTLRPCGHHVMRKDSMYEVTG